MSRTQAVLRGALLTGAAAVMVACGEAGTVVNPPVNNAIFQSYVALGNSITAGYQSGGINDSTQKLAYPVLLAHQMGTRFAYPSLSMPGCAPPVNNFLAGTRVTLSGQPASTALTCGPVGGAPRNLASVSATINNVAVPGIATADPFASGATAPNNNALMQLFLGGETMDRKALDNQPTFATVWVGNNDILAPALNGFPSTATPVATFTANYAKMMNELIAGAPGLKGVLIGVVQVAAAPLMFQAALIRSPAIAAAAASVAGRAVTLDPNTCTAGVGDNALINFQALAAIKSRPLAQPGTIYCFPVLGGGATDPGDAGILDITEQATVTALINGYNAYIKAKADSIGFGYYDPNPLLASLKANGSVPAFPNLTSAQPFGIYFSLDGVHPTGAAHLLIANDLITLINGKFGTSLTPAQ